jgi:YHS domain-containing protein
MEVSVRTRNVGGFLAGVLTLGLSTNCFAAAGEFGDLCAMALAGGVKMQADCSTNAIYQGKTYCFGDDAARSDFMKKPEDNLERAQSYYKSITDQ